MKWILCVIVSGGLVAGTVGAYAASTQGSALPGLLDEPVSVRQGSADRAASSRSRRGYSPALFYFGTRRHVGGGYGSGK